MKVLDPDPDFFSQVAVGLFLDGVNQTNVTVTVINDNFPEVNETFTWSIISAPGAQVGARNTLEMIISASDQPHGLFQFDNVSLQLYIHNN